MKERCHHTPDSSKKVFCCPQLSEERRQSIFNTVRQQIKSEQGRWNWYSSHIEEVSLLPIKTICHYNTKLNYQYCCVSMVKSCADWAGILYSWDVLFLNTHVKYLTHLLTALPNLTCVPAYLLNFDPFQIDAVRDRRREGVAPANRRLRLTTAQYFLPLTEGGRNIRVCQVMWSNNLGLNWKTVSHFDVCILQQFLIQSSLQWSNINSQWAKITGWLFQCWQERYFNHDTQQ